MFTQNYLPEVRKYFLFKGMLTLFVVSTFEGWPGILYTSIDSFAEVSSTSHVNTINFFSSTKYFILFQQAIAK